MAGRGPGRGVLLLNRRPLAATFALLATLIFAAAPTVNATSEFPAGWEGYHTYAETDAFLDDAVATPNAL